MYTEEYIRSNIDKVNWYDISRNQILSEDFIREFQDKVNWAVISYKQKLNENFIREFQDRVHWRYISSNQKLTTNFIRKFKNRINWTLITCHQNLNTKFIKEFQDKVDWYFISRNQKLSKNFMKEFKDKIDIDIQLKYHHNKLTLQEKHELIKKYCEQYKLLYDDTTFYAFRDHDKNGSGIWNKTIKYEKNKYYRDWRCNLDSEKPNSFGYGIFSKGNTKVKVKIEDVGCWVRDNDKLRVWGFEII